MKQTALTTFIDNVAILAIENCLLVPLEAIFTSLNVSNMESKQIKSLASEPAHVQSDREMYQTQLEKLRAGLRTLNILNTDRSSLSTPAVVGEYYLLLDTPWIKVDRYEIYGFLKTILMCILLFTVSRAPSPFENGAAE